MVDDYDELLAASEPLREAGALIAVDDAGAGYARCATSSRSAPTSSSSTGRWPTASTATRPRPRSSRCSAALAGRLDAWLLAEGIERRGRARTLVGLGVPLAQGYLLARPTDDFALAIPDDIAERLRERAEPAGSRA